MKDNIFAMSLLLPKNKARNWTSFWAVPTFTYGSYQVQSCLALTLSEASRVHLPVSSTSSSTPLPQAPINHLCSLNVFFIVNTNLSINLSIY
ncbi:unnamed protein product, partial [Brassica napus]